jgi:hypothetical protein
MKTFAIRLLTAALCLLAYTVAAQDEETRKLTAFERIKVTGGLFDIRLKQGTEPSVKVEARGDLRLRDISTEVRDGVLRVDTDRRDYRDRDKFYLEITYVGDLKEIDAHGAGNISSANVLKGTELIVELNGAGNVEIEVDVERLEAEMTGAGNMRLEGKTKFLRARLSGTGSVNAFRLEAEEANVYLSGIGNMRVNVKNALDADADGLGSIRYLGRPEKLRVRSGLLSSVKAEF